jgi:hypothetical protein
LVEKIQDDNNFELAFVWNRTIAALEDFKNKDLILEELRDFPQRFYNNVIYLLNRFCS